METTGDLPWGQLAGQVGRGADTASSGCVLLGCHELSKDLESGFNSLTLWP